MNLDIIVSLLPIVFIFHDLEEIIMMKPWITRNKKFLLQKFPKFAPKIINQYEQLSTSAFAFMVFILFILVSAISIFTIFSKEYYLWIGLFIVFTLHLLIHVVQFIVIRKYIPVIITSFLSLIYSYYAINFLIEIKIWNITLVIINTFIIIILTGLLFILLQKLALRFESWLTKFSSSSD
jgi:hypothetical protein